VVLEDGTKFLFELYDEGLDTLCDLTKAPDGVVRCVPEMAREQIAWADPTCTRRAASAPASCPPVRFVGTTVFRRLTPSQTYYSATCTSATPTFTGDLFAVEPFGDAGIAPPSSFVAFKDERVKITAEIDIIMKVGDDGSRIFLNEFYDDEHDVRAEIDGDRLLPLPSSIPSCCGEAADPISCGVTTAAPSPPGCPVFTMSSSAPLARVPKSTEIFRPGRPVKSLICPTFTYNPMHGYCVKSPSSPVGVSRALKVPSSCFAPVVARPSTTGRVRPDGRSMPLAVEGVLASPPLRRLSWPPYVRNPGLELLDTFTGKQCAVVRMTDGTYRCADFTPIRLRESMLFTDSSCTTPAATRGDWHRPSAQIDDATKECPQRGAVRLFDPAPTAKPTAQSYGIAADGTCIPLPVANQSTLNAGAAIEIAPSEFPEVEIWSPP
jgi:hypothetical protein